MDAVSAATALVSELSKVVTSERVITSPEGLKPWQNDQWWYAIAAAAAVAGGVDMISRVLKAVVFVASDPSFAGQPQVANGASELLQEVFGDAGVHVRSAVGVACLPLGACVEVELTVAL